MVDEGARGAGARFEHDRQDQDVVPGLVMRADAQREGRGGAGDRRGAPAVAFDVARVERSARGIGTQLSGSSMLKPRSGASRRAASAGSTPASGRASRWRRGMVIGRA